MKELFSRILEECVNYTPFNRLKQSKAESDIQAGEDAYEQGDFDVAFRIFSLLEKQGDPIARFYLKLIYKKGKNILIDKSESLKWFHMAANQNYAPAQFDLGILYFQGKRISKNYEKAASWFGKAAEQGHVLAQFNLGVMCTKGIGVPKNPSEGIKWYRKAAIQGLEPAQYIMGLSYFIGRYVPMDCLWAYIWFTLSSLQGNKRAGRFRSLIEEKLNSRQIEKGQTMIQNWNVKIDRICKSALDMSLSLENS